MAQFDKIPSTRKASFNKMTLSEIRAKARTSKDSKFRKDTKAYIRSTGRSADGL